MWCHSSAGSWRSTGKRRRVDAEKRLRNPGHQTEPTEKRDPKDLTFSEFVSQWRSYAETKFAPSTVRLYNDAIRNLIHILGARPLRSCGPVDMERFKSKHPSVVWPSKTNIDFADLKAIFNVAIKWAFLERNPCTGVKLIEVPPQSQPTSQRVTSLGSSSQSSFAGYGILFRLPWGR